MPLFLLSEVVLLEADTSKKSEVDAPVDMDFDDDHEDGDEEMASPTASSYDVDPAKNASRAAVSGRAEPETGSLAGSGNRSVVSGAGSSRYRECLKNHAVGMGGHAVDGCGEFMPAGAEGTLDGLRCAACSCHRNFHRKEADASGVGGVIVPFEAPGYYPPYYRAPAGYLHHNHHMAAAAAAVHQHHRPVMPLALPSTSGGGGHSTSRDEHDDVSNPMMAMAGGFIMSGLGASGSGSGKKRFRTKFTQEQKDKMLAFAERVGWRIQKHDEAAVQQFCEEACVKRHVLKVWMHNNKNTLGKKP